MLKSKGFTLIELLVVIAIIALLASVSLVMLQSARNRANRNSALQSARSVIPHLKACADENGYGIRSVAPTTAVYVCCRNAATTVAACDGATEYVTSIDVRWPDVTTRLGWAYGIPTGTLALGTYTYTLTKLGEATITCNVVGNNCN